MALLSGFGRVHPLFTFWAQACALAPGLPGDYLRIAYYRLTLEECSAESRIQFGSFFCASGGKSFARGLYRLLLCARNDANRREVANCLGSSDPERPKTAPRDAENRIMSSEQGAFTTVAIGADCWIGAGSIIMADIGSGTTIGAGSVVVGSIPAGSLRWEIRREFSMPVSGGRRSSMFGTPC